jgi:hypothetical protein
MDPGEGSVVDFPLRDEWTVERTPADRIPSHGTDAFAQRFAYDLVRTDGRRGHHLHPGSTLRWSLIGGRTEDCYGWGQPVHAATTGVVIAAVDGVPERSWLHPVTESWAALRTTIAVGRSGRHVDARRLAGDHVIIGSESTYALYAHLAPGSVAVRVGAKVSIGELVGRVGHSGNSTAPHLHFQLMDGPDPLTAAGIPCAFAAYLADRDGRWVEVQRGVPERMQRVRSVVDARRPLAS